jgi:hypothetical protein
MKEVTEWVYDCKCEDFCVPGKSKKCVEECAADCTSPHGKDCHTVWQPTCGKVHQRTLLIKYPVKKMVPTYRCEVVYMCDTCCGHCTGGAPVEQLPVVPPEMAPGAPPSMPPGLPPAARPTVPYTVPPAVRPQGELQLEPPRVPQPPLPPPPGQAQQPGMPVRPVSARSSSSFLSALFGAK